MLTKELVSKMDGFQVAKACSYLLIISGVIFILLRIIFVYNHQSKIQKERKKKNFANRFLFHCHPTCPDGHRWKRNTIEFVNFSDFSGMIIDCEGDVSYQCDYNFNLKHIDLARI
jgi:hypothetical protein